MGYQVRLVYLHYSLQRAKRGARDCGHRDRACVLVGLQGLGPFNKDSYTGRGDEKLHSSKVASRLKRRLGFGEEIRNAEKPKESQQDRPL